MNEITINVSFVIFLFLYIVMALITYQIIKDDLFGKYAIHGYEGITSKEIINFMEEYCDVILVIASALFPIYCSFKVGHFFGNLCFIIITDFKYENRVASWLVQSDNDRTHSDGE